MLAGTVGGGSRNNSSSSCLQSCDGATESSTREASTRNFLSTFWTPYLWLRVWSGAFVQQFKDVATENARADRKALLHLVSRLVGTAKALWLRRNYRGSHSGTPEEIWSLCRTSQGEAYEDEEGPSRVSICDLIIEMRKLMSLDNYYVPAGIRNK